MGAGVGRAVNFYMMSVSHRYLPKLGSRNLRTLLVITRSLLRYMGWVDIINREIGPYMKAAISRQGKTDSEHIVRPSG